MFDRVRRIGVAPIIALAAFLLVASPASSSVASKVIHSFDGGNGGGDPAGRLVFDGSGDLYGTTVVGGDAGCGTVYELPIEQFERRPEKVLYQFQCGADGKNPYGGVIFDGNGDLYGTTVAGGSGGACAGDGCGTVYELTPKGETVLYSFSGGDDGWGAGSAPAFDPRGDLVGTTPDGGAYSQGTVYELTPSRGRWHERVIHAFTGGADGGTGSLGALLVDGSGDLFGVTETGGTHSAGTVFEMLPDAGGAWDFRTLYTFKGQPDAASPYGGLVADAHGDLFGTTYYGGTSGNGAVFELRALSSHRWSESVVYDFKGGLDGANPTGTLHPDPFGDLVGTTTVGGSQACQCGTMFKIKLTTRQETVIHRFGATPGDGAFPYYGPIIDGGGVMYVTTAQGGALGQGAAVELQP